jgi:hypothetical protein
VRGGVGGGGGIGCDALGGRLAWNAASCRRDGGACSDAARAHIHTNASDVNNNERERRSGRGRGRLPAAVARDFPSHPFHNASSSSSSSSLLSPSRGFRAPPACGRAKEEWEQLQSAGHEVNPCNSPTHPAALAGIPLPVPGEATKSIQESYDAHSLCFICGGGGAR